LESALADDIQSECRTVGEYVEGILGYSGAVFPLQKLGLETLFRSAEAVNLEHAI
jgi:hypothetical protein